MTNRVFIDSSFWIPYRNEKEARHREAREAVTRLFRERTQLVTTLPVLCEIHARFSRSPKKCSLVLEDLCNNPVVVIEELSPGDRTDAIEILRDNRDKSYSLCDAISFVVMRRLGIKRAAAFDRHFHQIGEFEIIC